MSTPGMGARELHGLDVEPSPWMTKKEVADYLRVGERTVDRYADQGRITRHTVAGLQSVRFSRAEVEGLVTAE